MVSGDEILTGLEIAGRTLLFVDESGTSGKPLQNLEKDFMVFCGVEIASGDYSTVCRRMKDKLCSINSEVKEFHATEIVNPKKKSPWFTSTYQERIESLMLLKELFCEFCIIAPYCYISKKQYQSLVHGTVAEALSHKDGLKKVFFDAVLSTGDLEDKNYAVIFDSEKKLKDEILIKSLSLESGLVYENGVIIVSSEALPGLQLADFAVYVLNRMHHSVQRLKNGNDNHFDTVIIDAASDMRDKYLDLLRN